MTAPQKRLYFDNAATSFPKPPEVAQAVARYLTHIGASPGRGAYSEAVEAGRVMLRCRDLINKLIHGESADHVVFALNTTDALNLAIKGIAQHHRRKGQRVHMVTTWMDHNSTLRPLNDLAADGVAVTRVRVDEYSGRVDPKAIESAITADTRLVATVHASNVTGTLQPIGEIGEICRSRNIPFLVDAAQTIGHVPIDVQAMKIDLLAFPGHKGLLGPLGTGGLYLRPGMEKLVETQREGGTGTASERDVQPVTMPDKYEPGSQNGPGIAGLAEGVKWLLDRGIDKLWSHEKQLIKIMLDGFGELAGTGLTLHGSKTVENRCGVFSLVLQGIEPAEFAGILEEQFGILARAGLHCAPLAHQTLGTQSEGGATRLSLGPFHSEDDVRYAVASIGEICQALAGSRRRSHPQPA